MAKRISVDARRELVRAIGERYREAAREDNLRILDEFVADVDDVGHVVPRITSDAIIGPAAAGRAIDDHHRRGVRQP